MKFTSRVKYIFQDLRHWLKYALILKRRSIPRKDAARDLRQMSEEIAPLWRRRWCSFETLPPLVDSTALVDTYNQYHDFTAREILAAGTCFRQPHFAKVRLKMWPGCPSRRKRVSAVGITDKRQKLFDCGLDSPVAVETGYNQGNGSDLLRSDDKKRTVELELRRQFDIVTRYAQYVFGHCRSH